MDDSVPLVRRSTPRFEGGDATARRAGTQLREQISSIQLRLKNELQKVSHADTAAAAASTPSNGGAPALATIPAVPTPILHICCTRARIFHGIQYLVVLATLVLAVYAATQAAVSEDLAKTTLKRLHGEIFRVHSDAFRWRESDLSQQKQADAQLKLQLEQLEQKVAQQALEIKALSGGRRRRRQRRLGR
tara:strand:+ start:59 stop:628 length:570 start_codon:yes stop_codon:yes gene_type:complete